MTKARVTMTKRLHLDMCALKRPFDDQSQARIWIEAKAVTRIVALGDAGALALANSEALAIENEMNPKALRRFRVRELLRAFGRATALTEAIQERAVAIRALGFADMDALHLASAEAASCQFFLSCDDRLLRKCRKHGTRLRVTGLNPVVFLAEYVP